MTTNCPSIKPVSYYVNIYRRSRSLSPLPYQLPCERPSRTWVGCSLGLEDEDPECRLCVVSPRDEAGDAGDSVEGGDGSSRFVHDQSEAVDLLGRSIPSIDAIMPDSWLMTLSWFGTLSLAPEYSPSWAMRSSKALSPKASSTVLLCGLREFMGNLSSGVRLDRFVVAHKTCPAYFAAGQTV